MQAGSRNSGQSLVEFAILFPVIIYITLILIQIALIYNAYQVVNYAAYSSARAGIVYEADMEKMERAAFIAVFPIANRKISHRLSLRNLRRASEIIDDYYRSSFLKTTVKIDEHTESKLTVTVTHRFELIVPTAEILLVPILKIWDRQLYDSAQKYKEESGTSILPVRATCTLPI